jgi:DEAD/DEAH box helicase domain-containing protein
MSSSWDDITLSLAQKLGFDHLQGWQADLTQKVLKGNDIVLTAGTGRGKSTILLAPLLAKREADDRAVGLSIAPTKALGEDQVRVILVIILPYTGS